MMTGNADENWLNDEITHLKRRIAEHCQNLPNFEEERNKPQHIRIGQKLQLIETDPRYRKINQGLCVGNIIRNMKKNTNDGSIRQEEYEPLILYVLFMGKGKMKAQEVVEEIFRLIENYGVFSKSDFTIVNKPDSPQPRWQKHVHWARDKLANQKELLVNGHMEGWQHGYWQLTPAGEKQAELILGLSDERPRFEQENGL